MIGKFGLRLRGGLVGPIWWPSGAICHKELDIDLVREAARMGPDISMRDLMLHVTAENGGDFQSCNFTADTVIIVQKIEPRIGGSRIRLRAWGIDFFKSVSDMVSDTHLTSDFGGYD